jgi:hypothetical protein
VYTGTVDLARKKIHQLELLVACPPHHPPSSHALLFQAGKFYVILEYTAVGGLINGLSNAYFGAWGSFFNSVFCFGTWLKENKNIDFFVRESNEEEAEAEESAEP